jgi:hypothetical protein
MMVFYWWLGCFPIAAVNYLAYLALRIANEINDLNDMTPVPYLAAISIWALMVIYWTVTEDR